MIQSTCYGQLKNQPEEKGKMVRFRISSYKKVGEEVNWTTVFCSLFGKQGEWALQGLKEGDYVLITGQMYLREYKGKSYLSLDATHWARAGAPPKRGEAKPYTAPKGEREVDDSEVDDDDIPF